VIGYWSVLVKDWRRGDVAENTGFVQPVFYQ
jgi:hypothetical protein